MEELWHDLQKFDPRLGRATVFRAVEMLVNLGLLNRIEFSDGSHTYRACGDNHHHHLTCTKCHRIVDVDVCVSGRNWPILGKKMILRSKAIPWCYLGFVQIAENNGNAGLSPELRGLNRRV